MKKATDNHYWMLIIIKSVF